VYFFKFFKGLSQTTEIRGYHGIHAQESYARIWCLSI